MEMMQIVIVAVILTEIFNFVLGQSSALMSKYFPEETLVFFDEFETLDLRNRWKPEITLGSAFGNWEFQRYTNNRTNLYVKDKRLYIKPTLETALPESLLLNGGTMDIWGNDPPSLCTGNNNYGCFQQSSPGQMLNPVVSSRIRTQETFRFKYGRVEVRAKLPRGDWLWPAIWLLPANQEYGGWPQSGEIDIMESRGNAPTYLATGNTHKGGGRNSFHSTLHVGAFSSVNQYAAFTNGWWVNGGAPSSANLKNELSDTFHIYGLKWTEKEIFTYIDSPENVVLRVPLDKPFYERGGYAARGFDNPWKGSGPGAPFDQEFYLIMNVAVGGTNGYFPDGNGKPWSNNVPGAMNAFWQDKAKWFPTWNGENAAMVIESVAIYQSSEGTASGSWLDYVAATSGLSSLPPSYTQVQGTTVNYCHTTRGRSLLQALTNSDLSEQKIRVGMQINVSRSGEEEEIIPIILD